MPRPNPYSETYEDVLKKEKSKLLLLEASGHKDYAAIDAQKKKVARLQLNVKMARRPPVDETYSGKSY